MANSDDHKPAHLQLADAGYEVFIGNNRGTEYSRKHRQFLADGPTEDKYWDYAWTDLAKDVEASIESAEAWLYIASVKLMSRRLAVA